MKSVTHNKNNSFLMGVGPVVAVVLVARVLADGRVLPRRSAKIDELDGAAERRVFSPRGGHDGAVDLDGRGLGDEVHGGLGVAVERAVGLEVGRFFCLFRWREGEGG